MIGEECLKLAVLLGRGNECWSAKKKDDFFTQRRQLIIYLKNDNEYENIVLINIINALFIVCNQYAKKYIIHSQCFFFYSKAVS